MPDDVNFVVFFTRSRAYNVGCGIIYTLLPSLFFPRNRHPFPKEGFRRFVIRFCGSTYNTVNHLNITLDQNPVSPRNFIPGKLFFSTINTKQVQNPFFRSVSRFFLLFFLYCANERVSIPSSFFLPGNFKSAF